MSRACTRLGAALLCPAMVVLAALMGGQALARDVVTIAPSARCGPADALGRMHCAVGWDDDRMLGALEPQQALQWCWAAAVASLIKDAGHVQSQMAIVEEQFGAVVDRPLTKHGLLDLLNRVWTDERGNTFRSRAAELPPAGDLRAVAPTVLNELDAGRPLILGVRGGPASQGHIVLLAQAHFELYLNEDAVRLTGGKVIDPAPGEGVRPLRFTEIRPFFVATVRVESGAACPPAG
ncbi:hypothetical protein [Ramlibacter sp.]|uniref:hypothetical protein n=1 Tax=Ramlibacter sp. TaxID=1917967 RepID=UPI0035B4EE7E